MFLSLQFVNCLIDTCNFSDLCLKNTDFKKCIIRETHFINTHLSNCNFCDSDLRGTLFHNSKLCHANFVGAINYSIDIKTNQIEHAKFSQPEVLSLLQSIGIIIE